MKKLILSIGLGLCAFNAFAEDAVVLEAKDAKDMPLFHCSQIRTDPGYQGNHLVVIGKRVGKSIEYTAAETRPDGSFVVYPMSNKANILKSGKVFEDRSPIYRATFELSTREGSMMLLSVDYTISAAGKPDPVVGSYRNPVVDGYNGMKCVNAEK